MSNRLTCDSFGNAISSPASEAGPTPPGSPAGQMTESFGRAACPASPTPRQGWGLATPTPVTYGTTSFALFELVHPLSGWANRLRQRLERDGLTDCAMTWRKSVTPAGRLLFKRVRSVRRTSGTGFGLLPTVTAREGRDWSRPSVLARLDNGTGVAKRICAKSTQPLLEVPTGLNPSFAGWMMGYPQEWIDSAPSRGSETRLTRE